MALGKLFKNAGFYLVSLFMYTDSTEEKLRISLSIIFPDTDFRDLPQGEVC